MDERLVLDFAEQILTDGSLDGQQATAVMELVGIIGRLNTRIYELQDRLWSEQHERHMHDPFEGAEDG